jgi:hypothetical protein
MAITVAGKNRRQGAVAHVETKPSDRKAPGRKATATGALPLAIETGDGAPEFCCKQLAPRKATDPVRSSRAEASMASRCGEPGASGRKITHGRLSRRALRVSHNVGIASCHAEVGELGPLIPGVAGRRKGNFGDATSMHAFVEQPQMSALRSAETSEERTSHVR